MAISVYIYPSHASEWQVPQVTNSWKGFWGQVDDNALYLGMWTYHIRPGGNHNNNTNRMLGIHFKGIFFGKFVNSFYKPAYAAGIQRIIYSQKSESYLQFDIGYRLGLVWGYKSTHLFGKKPIPFDPLPFPQVFCNVSWELVGVQLSYSVAVVTAGFYIKI